MPVKERVDSTRLLTAEDFEKIKLLKQQAANGERLEDMAFAMILYVQNVPALCFCCPSTRRLISSRKAARIVSALPLLSQVLALNMCVSLDVLHRAAPRDGKGKPKRKVAPVDAGGSDSEDEDGGAGAAMNGGESFAVAPESLEGYKKRRRATLQERWICEDLRCRVRRVRRNN